MNDVLPLPPAHPFSQGLPRPPTPDAHKRHTLSPSLSRSHSPTSSYSVSSYSRTSSPSPYSLGPFPSVTSLCHDTPLQTTSTTLQANSTSATATTARNVSSAGAGTGSKFGALLSVPGRHANTNPNRANRQKRLSLSNYFLDIDIEYARRDVPRPKLVVTIVRPSPTQETFPAVEGGRQRGRRNRRERSDGGEAQSTETVSEPGLKRRNGIRRSERAGVVGRVETFEGLDGLEGLEDWEQLDEPHDDKPDEGKDTADEERADIATRRSISRESKRERRRLFRASLERLAILERMLEDTESDLERERERRRLQSSHHPSVDPRLAGGPRSAPVEHLPRLDAELELRRARSLEYHPFSACGRDRDSTLEFEYLLSSPGEGDEEDRGRYQLPALEFGPRLGLCLKSEIEALAPPPEVDDVLEFGEVLMPDGRGEWLHPFAAAV